MAKTLLPSKAPVMGPATLANGQPAHCPWCGNGWFILDTFRQSIYDPTTYRVTRIICGLCAREQVANA